MRVSRALRKSTASRDSEAGECRATRYNREYKGGEGLRGRRGGAAERRECVRKKKRAKERGWERERGPLVPRHTLGS